MDVVLPQHFSNFPYMSIWKSPLTTKTDLWLCFPQGTYEFSKTQERGAIISEMTAKIRCVPWTWTHLTISLQVPILLKRNGSRRKDWQKLTPKSSPAVYGLYLAIKKAMSDWHAVVENLTNTLWKKQCFLSGIRDSSKLELRFNC